MCTARDNPELRMLLWTRGQWKPLWNRWESLSEITWSFFLICKNPCVLKSRKPHNEAFCFESYIRGKLKKYWFVVFLYCHWLIQIKINILDIDECASNPCQNNGTCNDHIYQYTCTCVAGYSGYQCQIGNKLSDVWSITLWMYRLLINT